MKSLSKSVLLLIFTVVLCCGALSAGVVGHWPNGLSVSGQRQDTC